MTGLRGRGAERIVLDQLADALLAGESRALVLHGDHGAHQSGDFSATVELAALTVRSVATARSALRVHLISVAVWSSAALVGWRPATTGRRRRAPSPPKSCWPVGQAPSKTVVTKVFTPPSVEEVKRISTPTILAAAISLGTLKATPAHADDSNDATKSLREVRYFVRRKKGSTVPLSLTTIGFPRRSFAVGTSTRTQPSATLYS